MALSFVPTQTFNDNTQKCDIVFGTMALAGSGSYATGGIPIDFTGLGFSWEGPIKVTVKSAQPAGSQNTGQYQYAYVPSSATAPTLSGGFIQIFEAGAASGTIGAITITTTTNAGTSTPVYTNGGALTQVAGATGITGVQSPAFTGGAAAALAELPASSLPAGVTGDAIVFEAWFQRNI